MQTELDGEADEIRTAVPKVCYLCARWNEGTKSCEAFAVIPNEIWEGKNKHTKSFPGDKGILFKKFTPDFSK